MSDPTTILGQCGKLVGEKIAELGTGSTTELEQRIEDLEAEHPKPHASIIVKDDFNQPVRFVGTEPAESLYWMGTEQSIESSDEENTDAGQLFLRATANTDYSVQLVGNQGYYGYPTDSANADDVLWNDRGKVLRGEYSETWVITFDATNLLVDGSASNDLTIPQLNEYTLNWSGDLTKPLEIFEADGTTPFAEGVVVDSVAGTTKITPSLTAPSIIVIKADGKQRSVNIVKAPWSAKADTMDRINYNLLNVLGSKRETKTDKILIIVDGVAGVDYQFWAYIQYHFYYWKALAETAGKTAEFTGMDGSLTQYGASHFHNFKYQQYASNADWALLNKFENDYGGVPKIDEYYSDPNVTEAEYLAYFEQYDAVIYYAYNKYAYFSSNAISALAQFRENGGGLQFCSGWRYYVRCVNSIISNFGFAFYGGPVDNRAYSQVWDRNTGLITYDAHTGNDNLKIGTLKTLEYAYQDLWNDLEDDEQVWTGANSPYILTNTYSVEGKAVLDSEKSFLDLIDTPDGFERGVRNLRLNEAGDGLEFVGDNFVIDGEFRGMMGNLLHHRDQLEVNAGDEFEITDVSKNQIIYRTENNAIRYLRRGDEFHLQGNKVWIRIDEGEPTCSEGGTYDPDTNTCFPETETVTAFSTMPAYREELATNASGSYSVSSLGYRVRIVKTGNYASGWIDVHAIYNNQESFQEQIDSNDSDISNIQSDIALLQTTSGATASLYQKDELPYASQDASIALVSDGSAQLTPAMAYFFQGKWYRTLDNQLLKDNVIDIYLLAGQSNAHGHAKVSYLTEAQKTQEGVFYTSWHNSTSNASSQQYYSSWANELVAGFTRGNDQEATLVESQQFGPELGFVERANTINLASGRPVGILKHAIGASSLEDETSFVVVNGTSYVCIQSHQNIDSNEANYVASSVSEPANGTSWQTYWSVTTETASTAWVAGSYKDKGLSDWDLTATGDRRGDALRAFKLAIADGITKLENNNYTFRLAGMIWWQGESGATTSATQDFIAYLRNWLDTNYTLDMPKEQFPVVITTTREYWGTHLIEVANEDPYIGVVDTMDYASPAGASRTLVHPGSDETYSATQQEVDAGIATAVGDPVGGQDYDGDGVNDMFVIGQAYADQMALAKTGGTLWTPNSITPKMWVDFSDADSMAKTGNVIDSITDKSNDAKVFTSSGAGDIEHVIGQNGNYVARFSGGNDKMGYTSINYSSNTRQRWYLVFKATAVNNNLDAYFTVQGVVNSVTQQYILMALGGQSNEYLGRWYVHAPNSGSLQHSTTDLEDQWHIFEVEWDEPNSQASIWLDGNLITPNPVVMNGEFGSINTQFGFYGQYGDADWGEAIVVDNPTAEESEKLQGYLAHKWGLENLLPSNHEYKIVAP